MQALTCGEIIEATNGILVSGKPDTIFTGISTDSRNIKEGDLFVPIIGQRFDGHNFLEDSFKSGAAGALSQRDVPDCESRTIIRVPDTLKALGEIAAFYRRKSKIPFVAVTGSVGKTSTKDMIACILSRKYKVLKTEGNFNNEIGLPLTIFNLEDTHEAAVVEMGMSGFGEIRRLTSIVRPDIAVITNIGLSHVEKLGSRQNILKAKMEILEGLNEKGLAIFNGDDKLLYGLKDLLNLRTVFYGMEDGLDYQAFNVKTAGEQGSSFEISLRNSDYYVRIPVPGVHNIYNALAAIAVGVELKVPIEDIIDGISRYSPEKMRLNIVRHKGMKIIDDVYNASPQSVEAAINVLKDIGAGSRRIAVLGDMLELGEFTEKAHFDIGKFAVARGIDYIITIGASAGHIADGALDAGAAPDRVFSFGGNDNAAEFLAGFVKGGDVILVKGSRGMKMEEIVERLKRE